VSLLSEIVRSCSGAKSRVSTWGMFVLACGLVGCDHEAPPSAKGGVAAPISSLPPVREPSKRARAVAHASELELSASRAVEPATVKRLHRQAAELREALYLAEGKRADALEALESWMAASAQNSLQSCDETLQLVRLRGQVERDPEVLYRELYVLRERTADAACRARMGASLQLLAAAAPSQEELARLRKGAQDVAHAPAVPTGEESASQGDLSQVASPELLEKELKEPAVITRIEPFSAEKSSRVVIHVTHPTRFQVGELAASQGMGPRLFVDLALASYEGPPEFEQKGLVQKIRIGAQDKGTRVVFDLAKAAAHRVFYLPHPFRLIVDLSSGDMARLSVPREIRRVVLDPGHGGSDPGAIGPHGLREKDVTLDVAHRAAPLLAREVGVSTLLTRDVDVYVPLDERAARANAFNADLFLSVHMNSSPDSAARGVMTFVLDSSRDEAAAQIAARENSSTAAAAAELANSLSRIESSDRRAASELFAQLLQRAAGASLRQAYPDVEDHGVRRAGFYVLAGAAMPAALFEGSFISNPIEAHRLDSGAYRQRLADAIVNAVRAYKEGR
jgi:N-acetylmuramoyl-L-alanine amidase